MIRIILVALAMSLSCGAQEHEVVLRDSQKPITQNQLTMLEQASPVVAKIIEDQDAAGSIIDLSQSRIGSRTFGQVLALLAAQDASDYLNRLSDKDLFSVVIAIELLEMQDALSSSIAILAHRLIVDKHIKLIIAQPDYLSKIGLNGQIQRLIAEYMQENMLEALLVNEFADASYSSICWSFVGRIIACGTYNGTIDVWDVASGVKRTTLRLLDQENTVITSISINPAGTLLAATTNTGQLNIWNIDSQELIHTIHLQYSSPGSVAWNNQGSLLAVGFAGIIQIWKYDGKGPHLQGTLNCDVKRNIKLSWSPNGQYIAAPRGSDTISGLAKYEGIDILLMPAQNVQRFLIGAHVDPISCIAWNPSGKNIAGGSYYRTVRIWDIENGDQVQQLRNLPDAVRSISWHPKRNYIACGCADGSIVIWNLNPEARESMHIIKGHENPVETVAFSSDGRYMASLAGRKVRIWDAKILINANLSLSYLLIRYALNQASRLGLSAAKISQLQQRLLN